MDGGEYRLYDEDAGDDMPEPGNSGRWTERRGNFGVIFVNRARRGNGIWRRVNYMMLGKGARNCLGKNIQRVMIYRYILVRGSFTIMARV